MAAAAAPSRFLGTVHNQVGDAKLNDAVREFALTTLGDARKHEGVMRRGIKVFPRVAKVMWWTYKLGVTATVGLVVVKVANKVAELPSDGPGC
ncbi:hypothetical protein PAHAL_2G020900 [Panicum hallii]|uniref:Uncharacterized protein n=1 Tax=Panicum hallii TaxID=206008 RepID=A0A2S3GVK4_9POAL|nr:hypothetical protein PAHAL_2G020900 [Panicum hallii]